MRRRPSGGRTLQSSSCGSAMAAWVLGGAGAKNRPDPTLTAAVGPSLPCVGGCPVCTGWRPRSARGAQCQPSHSNGTARPRRACCGRVPPGGAAVSWPRATAAASAHSVAASVGGSAAAAVWASGASGVSSVPPTPADLRGAARRAQLAGCGLGEGAAGAGNLRNCSFVGAPPALIALSRLAFGAAAAAVSCRGAAAPAGRQLRWCNCSIAGAPPVCTALDCDARGTVVGVPPSSRPVSAGVRGRVAAALPALGLPAPVRGLHAGSVAHRTENLTNFRPCSLSTASPPLSVHSPRLGASFGPRCGCGAALRALAALRRLLCLSTAAA